MAVLYWVNFATATVSVRTEIRRDRGETISPLFVLFSLLFGVLFRFVRKTLTVNKQNCSVSL